MHAGALPAAEGAAQIDDAGPQLFGRRCLGVRGAPVQLGLSLRIGIGKTEIGHRHLDSVAIDRPAQLARQLLQGQRRFLEHAREIDGTVLDGQLRTA